MASSSTPLPQPKANFDDTLKAQKEKFEKIMTNRGKRHAEFEEKLQRKKHKLAKLDAKSKRSKSLHTDICAFKRLLDALELTNSSQKLICFDSEYAIIRETLGDAFDTHFDWASLYHTKMIYCSRISKYTISEACDENEVGWRDIDPDEDEIVDEDGLDIFRSNNYVVYNMDRLIARLEEASLVEITHDGDQHGVYALSKVSVKCMVIDIAQLAAKLKTNS